MPLDRNTVDKTSAEHIRNLRRAGQKMTPVEQQAIRKEHERVARKVEHNRRKR